MKFIVLLLLISSSSLVAKAVPGGPKVDCNKGMTQAQANPGNDEIVKQLGKMRNYASIGAEVDHPATKMATVLCSFIDTNDDVVKNSEEALFEMIGHELKPKNPSRIDVIKYLNENSDKMICDDGLHYLKFAVKENLQLVFITGLFSKKDRFYTNHLQLDFNTITLTYNPETGKEEPMTVLDYINKVALPPLESSTDPREKKLRGRLIAFKKIITNEIAKKLNKPKRFLTDAKTFDELRDEMTLAERSKWDPWYAAR